MASFSNRPQVGKSGGNPKPKNDNADSVIIAFAIPKVAETIIGDITLGRMWRRINRVLVVPMDLAASTNSRSLSASTSPRTIRAVGIQLVIPIETVIRIKIPFSGPNALFKTSRNNNIITSKMGSRGSARNKSVIRINRLSRRLKNPAKTPMKLPSTSAKSMAVNPTAIEVCPPAIIRARVSRPNWSVPKGCAQFGLWLRARISI